MISSRFLAILFTLFSVGAIRETHWIFTSNAPDIAENKASLMIMSSVLTAVMVFLATRFWIKAGKEK